jgi:hypothetical protein
MYSSNASTHVGHIHSESRPLPKVQATSTQPLAPTLAMLHDTSLYKHILHSTLKGTKEVVKMAVFPVLEHCSLVQFYPCLTGNFRPHYQGKAWLITLMMDATSTSETSVNFYHTARRNNPEGSHLCIRRFENLRSHLGKSDFIYFDFLPFVNTVMNLWIT